MKDYANSNITARRSYIDLKNIGVMLLKNLRTEINKRENPLGNNFFEKIDANGLCGRCHSNLLCSYFIA